MSEGLPVTDGLSALILEATSHGFDVTIRMMRRDDGKVGVLNLPAHWARRLGYDPDKEQTR